MKKLVTVGFIAASLLLSGCSSSDITEDSPLTSKAQGLGEPKVEETLFQSSQFSEVYESTDGAISFESLDNMDWKVKRILKAPEGEKLPKGDNFEATAAFNFSYYDLTLEWVKMLKETDGWTASDEVVPQPREMENELYRGSKEDYRAKNPYSVELKKGKTTMNVSMSGKDNTVIVKINSQ